MRLREFNFDRIDKNNSNNILIIAPTQTGKSTLIKNILHSFKFSLLILIKVF